MLNILEKNNLAFNNEVKKRKFRFKNVIFLEE